jgi:regulator of protease activity HflC (stomatin/prohibitin superfamily)
MATIKRYGFISHLRSEASSHIIHFRSGKKAKGGRGLAFWFLPQGASIAELPVDDREMALFTKARTQDFQEISLQGNISWHIIDPDLASDRIDFSIGLQTGNLMTEPVDIIEGRIAGLANQAAAQYFAEASVRAVLDAGLNPVRAKIEAALADSPALRDIGVEIVAVRITHIAPSAELERALQTPTFESLQQKADEAVYERRALAVDKERAIAENELANKTELAKRETQLIEQESANARSRATASAEAGQIEADAEAARIRTIEGAQSEAEQSRIAIYRDLPSHVLLGLAAREFAGKLETINNLNVTPDLLSALVGELGKGKSGSGTGG